MSIHRVSHPGFAAVAVSLLTFALAGPASAESLYAVDAYDSRLWIIDPSDGSTVGAHELSVNAGSIHNGNGLAVEPISGEMYAILTIDSDQNRSLVTINPETGLATVISNTGYPFAAITFDDIGTLYGVTGSANYISADSRNALFEIDPTDGSLTQLCKFPATNQGHSLGFGDGLIYHAAQVGTDFYGDVHLETVDPSSFPVDPTELCTTSAVTVAFESGGIPVHPQSILVTDTGVSTAELLLAGWGNYNNCCSSQFFGISTSGSSGTATRLGYPDEYYKGLAFHAFEPVEFVATSGLTLSKVAAKVRDGKERHIVYTIEVTNTGSDAVPNVTLLDILDDSKLVYVSDNSGCDLPFAHNVVCDLGTLGASETRTITIDTRVACKGKSCASVDNTARLTISTDQWVDDPDNATQQTTISTSLKGKY